MEEEQEEKKGFRVIDKRSVGREQETEPTPEVEKGATVQPKGEPADEKKTSNEGKTAEAPPLPEVTFSGFIYSLSTSILINLGEIVDPITQQTSKNLSLAKQTIDILGILEEKTKGNLTESEESLLRSLLYDLRMRYVKATS